MATEKILNTKIKLRYDSHENWIKNDPVLMEGELALSAVTVKQDGVVNTVPSVLIKCGDNTHKYSELGYVFARAADVVDACKSETALTTFVNNVIADAGIASSEAMGALATRVTTAEGEIDALQADLNTAETGLKARVTTAEGAIDALETLVGDTKVADQITAAINALNLSTTYEAKGEAAKVQTALNEYKTSNDAAVLANTNNITANANAITAIKDGTTIDSFKDVEEALAGKEAAGAAAAAETAAKAYADDLAGNYDAKGAAATAESNAKTYAKEYADGLAGNYDASGSAAQALTDAKEYTDGKLTTLVGETPVAEQISTNIANLKLAETYAAKVHTHTKSEITDFAHNHEISEVNGLQDALDGKQAVGDYATKAEAQGYADAKDEAIAAAKAAADKAQEEVDALETYVGTIPSDEKYADITNVVAYINKKAEETLASAQGGSSETAASVKAALETYKAANDPKVNANTEAIAALEELVGDEKVSDAIASAVAAEKERAEGIEGGLETRLAAVEGDYLKTTDKAELQGNIDTVSAAVERLTNGVSADEIDGVNDLINYVNTHGTEVTGMKADIKANADAIGAIEADYLKSADKTELSGLITGLDTRMGAAETAIGTKAAQADLESLAGRVTTIETEHNTEATGLKARLTAAEADIDALETKVGDETVAAQIEDAITNANLGQYALASELDTAEGKIETLEGKAHTHTNQTELDKIAEGDKAKWDAAVQTVTPGTGLTATKTGTDVAIAFDDSVTFIFDCGTSAV